MKFRVGDRVYCKEHREYGFIVEINDLRFPYPVVAILDGYCRRTYTIDGRWHSSHIKPDLILCLSKKINKILKV